MGPHRRLKYPQRKYLRMTLPTADLVEILPPAKTRLCALSDSEMGCVKPQKCSSNGTSSICTMETIEANPAFLDCGARHSQYRPAPAAPCQWVKYSKTITRLMFLPAAAPGQAIPAALPCLALACILAVQLVANTHGELDSGTDPARAISLSALRVVIFKSEPFSGLVSQPRQYRPEHGLSPTWVGPTMGNSSGLQLSVVHTMAHLISQWNSMGS